MTEPRHNKSLADKHYTRQTLDNITNARHNNKWWWGFGSFEGTILDPTQTNSRLWPLGGHKLASKWPLRVKNY